MKKKKKRIQKAHNNMFVKAFGDVENVRVFLNMALPESLKETLDLSKIHLEFTNYISDELKDGLSDLVVKTVIRTGEQGHKDADIYFLMEHKSYVDDKALVQILKYMYSEWQKDVDHKKPLRVIIPLIFYHGKKKWTVPRSFVEKFKVSETIKEYLVNFKYVFFDTKDWDFMASENQELKDNVFLLTTLILMQNAFNKKWETVIEIFKFWQEKGFTSDKEKITAMLTYITEIQPVSMEQLKKVLDENKFAGGELMQSLAESLRREGWEKGQKDGMRQNAKRMLYDDVPIDRIAKYTGLTEKEIKELMC